MATVVNTIGVFANGAVTAQVDFSDVNGSIAKSRIINNSPYPAKVTALLNPAINGFSSITVDGPANQTVEQNFPNNTVKYTRVTDPETGLQSWDLIGVELHCQWPA